MNSSSTAVYALTREIRHDTQTTNGGSGYHVQTYSELRTELVQGAMHIRKPQNTIVWLPQIAASLLLHVALLFVLTRTLHPAAVHVLLPGTQKGTRIDLAYNPGRAPLPTLKAAKEKPPTPAAAPILKVDRARLAPPVSAALVELSRPHLPPLPQQLPSTDYPPSAQPDAASGSDSLGSGDVQIALTTYSPRPRPDLSTLPRGTQGDVILDVTIDPTGSVADLQILQALGYGVEGKVIETVRTWRFRPATRDGLAIASVQELHFHFGPA